ncbi:MAG TPA: hypothetical protein DHW61_09155 [Lachnoclostridium phytofermentans]|uniref:Uncharacterized protein n=1 Tax=Lachnoclostridium phytofermentans TaxID=66219 RepID=A0A3D2X887_9FIRM|nr:hypothetical protein [Lachnoclostridium sp.]HCL02568.1 hypothetical protein [Lachnoclostridium phytofermentans]
MKYIYNKKKYASVTFLYYKTKALCQSWGMILINHAPVLDVEPKKSKPDTVCSFSYDAYSLFAQQGEM